MITWPEQWPPRSTAVACVDSLRLELVVSEKAWITEAALAAAYTCEHVGVPVTFQFNGHWLTAYPGQPSEEVVAIYWSRISDVRIDMSSPHMRQNWTEEAPPP